MHLIRRHFEISFNLFFVSIFFDSTYCTFCRLGGSNHYTPCFVAVLI